MGMVWMQVLAQEKTTPSKNEPKKRKTIVRPARCPRVYINTSTGINNNTAIMGFSFDVPLPNNLSVEAGVGTGTWGDKIYAGLKYYLSPCQRGFAVGLGLAYCPGVPHDSHDLETIYGTTETIVYNKNPQTSLLLMAYKYWTIGKKYNRLYAETGWSMPITSGDKITQLSGHPMSSKAMDGLNSGIESAPILAVGVSFGIY